MLPQLKVGKRVRIDERIRVRIPAGRVQTTSRWTIRCRRVGTFLYFRHKGVSGTLSQLWGRPPPEVCRAFRPSAEVGFVSR